MGSGDGWFGKSAIIYLIFIRECLIAKFDFIILECTANFDVRGLSPFQHLYEIVVLTFSPTLLGFPATRLRKYMMLIRRSHFRFLPEAAEYGHYELFEKLFGRTVELKGVDMSRAPDHDVDVYKRAMALQRGMPLVRNSGRAWSSYHVMTASVRRMVRAHEQCVAGRGRDFVCNARQHATCMSATERVPALLRNSLLWNLKLKRFLLPAEHMEIQGLQMYEPDGDDCAVASHVRGLADKHVRSLTGNGMHCAAVGTILMYMLAVIERLPED